MDETITTVPAALDRYRGRDVLRSKLRAVRSVRRGMELRSENDGQRSERMEGGEEAWMTRPVRPLAGMVFAVTYSYLPVRAR